MKKVLLTIVLFLLTQGCSQAEIGPYATDAFNEKYSGYADFYNTAVYSGEGIGAWMDEYELAFFSTGKADFANELLVVDLSHFNTALQTAKAGTSNQPTLDPLDGIVKQTVAKSEQLVALMSRIQEYYAHQSYSEDQYAWIKGIDPELQSLADELTPLFNQLEGELIRLRKEADAQLITRYQTSGDALSAELVKVMSLYDTFSASMTAYMAEQAVDLTKFETDIKQTDQARTHLLTLSETSKNLKKANRTKAQMDQFADTLLQGEQTLRHILGTMREGNELLEEDILIFETLYNSMVEQLNTVNE